MTDVEKIAFKQALMQKCVELIEKRIAAAALAMANAQAAANAEEKSSAGDKYETSRAMSHLEKDLHARQLAANRLELSAALSVDCAHLYDSVVTGCFVDCGAYSFFIAAGLGKIHFAGKEIYLLSPNAPVAKLLFKKVQGSQLIFNKVEMVIQTVF